MKKTILILVIAIAAIIFIIWICTKGTELDEVLAKGNYIIVDVRTSEEYRESHIKGAINIPYDEIDRNTKLDKTKTILVYCKSGTRSTKAYNTLKTLGYDVINLGAYANIDMEKV